MFSISIGAHLGASSPIFAPLLTHETWDALEMARNAFGKECDRSPSLSAMRDSIKGRLSALPEQEN